MTRRGWYWALGLAFAVHNAEELATAPLMLNLMQSRAPVFVREFYEGIGVSELRLILVILIAAGVALAAAAARNPETRGWSYTMLVFGAVIGLNAVAHIGLAIAFGGYMPGLITAAFVSLPLFIALLVRSRKEGWVPANVYWTILPAALVVHGPLLAGFIRATLGIAGALT